jgi:hypothetical protein
VMAFPIFDPAFQISHCLLVLSPSLCLIDLVGDPLCGSRPFSEFLIMRIIFGAGYFYERLRT